jgi:hypothetical protein
VQHATSLSMSRSVFWIEGKQKTMSWLVVFGMLAICSVPILMLLWMGWGQERWLNRRLKPIGVGMAKKRGTWEIEYGDEPNPQR